MSKNIYIVSFTIFFLSVGGLLWWQFGSGHTAVNLLKADDDGVVSSSKEIPVPPLTKTYEDDSYRFSLRYPDSYAISSSDDPSGKSRTILIQDQEGKGIQILVTPFTDADTAITPDRVQRDIPDMEVSDPEEVEMTIGGGKGLAFKSDNPEFGGASREVWFVFHGNLYQISAYIEYDGLLKAMLNTWKFF